MKSYKEWLEESIPISKTHFEKRKDYYRVYLSHVNPRDFYDRLVKLEK